MCMYEHLWWERLEEQTNVGTVKCKYSPQANWMCMLKWKAFYLFNYNRLLKVHSKTEKLYLKRRAFFCVENLVSITTHLYAFLIWRLTVLFNFFCFSSQAVNEQCCYLFGTDHRTFCCHCHMCIFKNVEVANWPKLTGLMNKQCLSPNNIK